MAQFKSYENNRSRVSARSDCLKSSKMGNNQSDNQPAEISESDETSLDNAQTTYQSESETVILDKKSADIDNPAEKRNTLSDQQNYNSLSGNITINETDKEACGIDKTVTNHPLSDNDQINEKTHNNIDYPKDISCESSSDLNKFENSHKPYSDNNKDTNKLKPTFNSTQNIGKIPKSTMNNDKNIHGDLNDNNNKNTKDSNSELHSYLPITQDSRSQVTNNNSKKINNSEIDLHSHKNSTECVKNSERFEVSGSNISTYSQEETVSHAKHCEKEHNELSMDKYEDSNYGILTEGGMKVQNSIHKETTQVNVLKSCDNMDNITHKLEGTSDIIRKTRKTTKRNAVILQKEDGLLVDSEDIKQWIKSQHESFLKMAPTTTSNSYCETSPRTFCKKITENCKVIITPEHHENQTISSEPFEMVDSSCQTLVLDQNLINNNGVQKKEDQSLTNLQTELRVFKEKEKSDSQKLNTTLLNMKKLEVENARLQAIIQEFQEKQNGSTVSNNDQAMHLDSKIAVEKNTSLSEPILPEIKDNIICASVSNDNETDTQQNKMEPSAVISQQTESDSDKCEIVEMSTKEVETDYQDLVKEDSVETHAVNTSGKEQINENQSTESNTSPEFMSNESIKDSQNKAMFPDETNLSDNKSFEYETDEESLGSICERNLEENDKECGDLRIVESGDEQSDHDESKESLDRSEDISLPNSPCKKDSTCGFSFDDILKANLEYLSDEEDDLFQKNFTTDKESKKEDNDRNEHSFHTDSSEDNQDTSQSEVDGQDICDTEQEDHNKVSDRSKFWETKLTALAKDKCVADENNVCLDSDTLGNIHKTKQKWEEIFVTANNGSPSPKRRSLEGLGGIDSKNGEFDDETMGNNVQQSKLRWQEMISSGQNSGSASSRRRSLEELNGSSQSGSDLEESFGAVSNILKKKQLWEGMHSSQQNLSTNDELKRMTLAIDSTLEKAEVSKTKMKFEELLDKKDSPKMPRRDIRLVSKTEEELEAEFMSSDVMLQSIADVSNTKSKWEKLVSGDTDEIQTVQKQKVKKVENFVSLREKFEPSASDGRQIEDASEC